MAPAQGAPSPAPGVPGRDKPVPYARYVALIWT